MHIQQGSFVMDASSAWIVKGLDDVVSLISTPDQQRVSLCMLQLE